MKTVENLVKNMPKQLFFITFTAILFLSASAFAQKQTNEILQLLQPLEKQIKGGETQSFALQISANQTAVIIVEQKGIDVSLAAFKPNGERFIDSETPSGLLGNDSILITANDSGEYKVSVSPADPRSTLGKYIIQIKEIRPTVQKDFQVNEAAMKITKTAEESEVFRRNGTREGRLKALEKWQEVIGLSRLKQDQVWEVVALITSGLIYEQLGELQKAVEFYTKGLELTRIIKNRQYEGSAINNIGYVQSLTGNYEQAIYYYNQSLELEKEVGNVRGEAISLNNVGTAYMFLEDLPKAQEFYEKSLILRRQINDERGESNTLNNLGQVFDRSGNYQKSLEFLQQSYEIRKKVADKRGEANSVRNLGKVFFGIGDKTKSLEYFTQANEMARTLGERRIEADSFYWIALIERENGNLTKAIEYIQNGLKIVEQTRGELLNPELRISYFSTVQQFYELYTELLVARYEKSKDEKDISSALEISERARTRSLVELLQEARVNIKQGVDEKLLEKAEDFQNSLNNKYRQRATLLSGKNTPEQISKITNEITALTTEIENLQIKIKRENPHYANLTQETSLSTKEIQSLLDDKTVLLEYKLGEKRSFLWFVSKDSIKLFTLPARKHIEKTARDFYDSVILRERKNELKTNKLSAELGEILIAPIASTLGNKRLAIVSDGVLQFIPFSALSLNVEKSKTQRFLGDTNEITILPSISVIDEMRRDSKFEKKNEKTIAIFADPIFESNDPRVSQELNVNERSVEIKRVLRDFKFGDKLPRLLSSRVEARNISAFLSPKVTDLNIDFDANRENATADKLADYQILHFATHGLLDTSRPELSGLVFSLYDKTGKTQDGFLRLNQIYNLNLNSDLVVLSACQTALGKDVRGEGLIGLTRGFMYAGANRVVASLWKVDDAATAEFMKLFYRNLLQKKLAPSAALSAAQNEMKQIPRYKSPYFWAAFSIQGDWL